MSKRLLVTSDRLGGPDEELGLTLTESFFHHLAQGSEAPSEILLLNGGVRLACEGSPCLDGLRALVERGTVIRSCVTCLKHFGLIDDLVVGEVGTMPATVELLMGDAEVVTLA